MKSFLTILLLAVSVTLIRGDEVPELTALKASCDQATLTKNETLRQKYVTDLASLRWKLVREKRDGWDLVDLEIVDLPAAPAASDKSLGQMRLGSWCSPRHSYLFKPDGTWRMTDLDDDPDATHGTWSFHQGTYLNEGGVFKVILLTARVFIYASAGSSRPNFEWRPNHDGTWRPFHL
jgi:hypothetical protein